MEERTYVKPPDKAFQTVGFHKIFAGWLAETYGNANAELFERYLSLQKPAELWCRKCGQAYPLRKFGPKFDLEWVLEKDGTVGPLHITKPKAGPFKNPYEIGAFCENKDCHNQALEYNFVGNLRTLALAEMEIMSLSIQTELALEHAGKKSRMRLTKKISREFSPEIWHSTTYSMAFGNRNDSAPLDYLVKNGLATMGIFDLDNARVHAYKLNENGIRELRFLAGAKFFDNFGFIKQLYEYCAERLERLDKYIEVHEKPDISVKHVAGKKSRRYDAIKLIEHVPEKYLPRILSNDKRAYQLKVKRLAEKTA